ncbi:kelch repeat-containing protein [Kitasatospora cinereorecta]|uniref:Uncharacterized protein n=1 Tax=Kitasatospora cinereorecta TaxID=285560 RepID=A0ABW0VN46_9ACTN
MPGTWQALTNQPTFNASTMLLLTDGTVMCQDSGTQHWWKLAPDANGDYVHGTWSQLADGPNGPLYYASAVLRDGRVLVAGGEYNFGSDVELNEAEIYDPLANTWTSIATPDGWTAIGDAVSVVFPDGRVMIGSVLGPQCAIYDPVANTWTAAASKNNSTTNEETWTLLPDQTVLTVDCAGHPGTEKYLISADRWVSAGSTPVDLVEAASSEIGPALLLPDGRVFAIGATGNTALYTMPPLAGQQGSWAAGPSFPTINGQTLGAKDAPGCLLPNGRVLCVAGPVDGVSGDYLTPTYFFEFDPASGALNRVADPANSGAQPFAGRMLLLPSGQLLFSNGSTDVQVYSPDGGPDGSWRPQITTVPALLRPGGTYTLHGRQINGLSQAVSYGDDAQMATNYPIVRLEYPDGRVGYCRTHGFSTMGVQTGTVVHQTRFTVPAGTEIGQARIVVVANGIASAPVPVGVSNKPFKELKWEIKETKEFIKAEIDVIVKNRDIETKVKEVGDEGDPWHLHDLGDPPWLTAVREIAKRTDVIEEALHQRSFIRAEERPELGAQALEASARQEQAAREPNGNGQAGDGQAGSAGARSGVRRAEAPPSRSGKRRS